MRAIVIVPGRPETAGVFELPEPPESDGSVLVGLESEMRLADEYLISGRLVGAAVFSHIANVIHVAMKKLEEPED